MNGYQLVLVSVLRKVSLLYNRMEKLIANELHHPGPETESQ